MSTNTRDTQERTARIGPATIFLGVDGEGREHVYRRLTRAVHVMDGDGERVHVARLGDTHVNKWMIFIDEELCGWDNAEYGSWAYEPEGLDE